MEYEGFPVTELCEAWGRKRIVSAMTRRAVALSRYSRTDSQDASAMGRFIGEMIAEHTPNEVAYKLGRNRALLVAGAATLAIAGGIVGVDEIRHDQSMSHQGGVHTDDMTNTPAEVMASTPALTSPDMPVPFLPTTVSVVKV